ncbi:3'-5' exonuclease domain-containing protein 2 [Bowmanella sp. Y26]|uniref:3'-5' exonuclease n=1 Tax=Bowmanella yangjiangensis TaxID=2811230 RepID=UPI001BDD8291|nr:3'-5' exonuclease [Bowmanella yangjiangensis]MBT1065534.1 3'-5' exonuclease domain-containing protein 2 [Bowmanella yangjiangensis]
MQPHSYLTRPSKQQIRELPPFAGLTPKNIHMLTSGNQVAAACQVLEQADVLGFDTESKPSFVANQSTGGPHLLQLATDKEAFLFSAALLEGNAHLATIIQAEHILKVGFGLRSDRGPLQHKLGVALKPCVDLAKVVKSLGYKDQVGVQAAVAIVLKQYLPKSKHLSTSNWARLPLSEAQIAYAANDAYASLCVYRHLLRASPQLFNT